MVLLVLGGFDDFDADDYIIEDDRMTWQSGGVLKRLHKPD